MIETLCEENRVRNGNEQWHGDTSSGRHVLMMGLQEQIPEKKVTVMEIEG